MTWADAAERYTSVWPGMVSIRSIPFQKIVRSENFVVSDKQAEFTCN